MSQVGAAAGGSDAGSTQAATSAAPGKALADAWSARGSTISGIASSAAVASAASEEVRQWSREQKKLQTLYTCGECSEETPLEATDPVQCNSCGNRILYKKRGTVPVQYEAR
eukprot:TRINITY_DN43560_c0_g1_i1.p2 TRINITY_DN43560_c0_g1~~TRINITY_DN43560_c0_g1_i1.p2  ORF type:complete len:112 (+),score=35.31 TRINITY_DN43560_c0_g1_i1:64-399(+)